MFSTPKPTRAWQEIAEEASHATNWERLVELSKELMRSSEERDNQLIRNIPGKAAQSASHSRDLTKF